VGDPLGFLPGLPSDPLAMTQQYLKLKRLQQRKKKNVDTRASKGRKLRYHTHEKLVGFMVSEVWPTNGYYPLLISSLKSTQSLILQWPKDCLEVYWEVKRVKSDVT
jgi:hypothetical protein